MTGAFARLKAANADLERRDARLREELREARARTSVTAEGGSAQESVEVGDQRISDA